MDQTDSGAVELVSIVLGFFFPWPDRSPLYHQLS